MVSQRCTALLVFDDVVVVCQLPRWYPGAGVLISIPVSVMPGHESLLSRLGELSDIAPGHVFRLQSEAARCSDRWTVPEAMLVARRPSPKDV